MIGDILLDRFRLTLIVELDNDHPGSSKRVTEHFDHRLPDLLIRAKPLKRFRQTQVRALDTNSVAGRWVLLIGSATMSAAESRERRSFSVQER